MIEKTAHLEADFEEAGLWLCWFLDITCVKIIDFNRCLYKSVIN